MSTADDLRARKNDAYGTAHLIIETPDGARIELLEHPFGPGVVSLQMSSRLGWAHAWPERDDWVALRDWITAQIESGVIR